MTPLPYDLAKEMKDAGWPFPDVPPYGEWDITKMSPSLSELIEACGEGFDELYRVHHTECFGASGGYGEVIRTIRHKTPEEAVARLWLELKRKAASK